MALWGTKDTVYSTGNITTIAITNGDGVITGDGTTWDEALHVGKVITIGGNLGSGVIKSVDSATQVTLVGDTGLTAVGGLVQTYNISEQPKSAVLDTNYEGNEIYGVDTTEQGVANDATGEARLYAPPHAGWVGVTTYTDTHGNLRVKSETLVAMSADANSSGGVTTDAEDTYFPDA